MLSGQDVARGLESEAGGSDVLLVPDVMLREGDGLFLDDMSTKELGKKLKIEVRVIESSPAGLYEAVKG